ncbi:unnamed protein product [Porites lobata]|uniref:mannose-6-phosphate isomerase n=1 Tax=Porites lobata TaxID=104759 RepID=A0ABN8R8Z4_9CNID|nr:unnamed protein product [Porites lobata]
MGTHPNGPSIVLGKGKEILLSEWIESNKDVLGEAVKEAFDSKLPFLLKVLSVNKALSIQAHPNKVHAAFLHRERPEIYKDPNHKPEMAIALTPFEGLCGFRPLAEIQSFVKTIPELAAVIGQEAADAVATSSSGLCSDGLKKAFTALMTCSPAVISLQLNKLFKRITEKKSSGDDLSSYCGELLLRLNSQFPGDGGCFCIYFLNHIVLKPGEAMFLGPNLPHAYLAGDCVECMACSDNVVRAGLTPKLKDVDTLCEMLDYSCRSKEENIFPCHQDPNDPFTTIYDPPVPDFAVARIQASESSRAHITLFFQRSGPCITVIVSRAFTMEALFHQAVPCTSSKL